MSPKFKPLHHLRTRALDMLMRHVGTQILLISTVRFGINLRLEKSTEPQNLQILKITDYYKSKIITFFLYLSKESMQR